MGSHLGWKRLAKVFFSNFVPEVEDLRARLGGGVLKAPSVLCSVAGVARLARVFLLGSGCLSSSAAE